MDSIDFTVILGPIDDYPSKNAGAEYLITSDEYYDFVMKACKHYPNNHFFLIGKAYSKFGSLTPCSNVTVVPDHPTRIFRHFVKRSRTSDSSKYLSPVDVTPFGSQLEFLKYTDKSVLFVHNDDRLVRNAFEVAALVKTNKIDNRFFARAEKGRISHMAIEVVPDIFSPNTEYNYCVISDFSEAMSKRNIDAMKNLILEGIDFLRFYIHAGFHVRKNSAPVPGWCLQVNGTWISLVLSMLQIKTMSPDLEHRQEITNFARYREMLFYASLAILSNLVIRCKYADADQVRKIYESSGTVAESSSDYIQPEDGGAAWTSRAVWDEIRKMAIEKNFNL